LSALRSVRTFLFGVGLAALVAAVPLVHANAQGAPAVIKGTEQANFGRMLFTLPTAQKMTARISNGVLIVGFSEPVEIAADRIVRELPSYVSVVRVDPDGKGMRFALTRTLTPNLLEAGERVFIDLIPEGWQGMLPGLPREVVEELSERLRRAEATARELSRSRDQAAPREVTVRLARLPTLSRLVFDVPSYAMVDHRRDGDKLDIAIRGGFTIEPARLRAVLPEGLSLDSIEAAGGAVRLRLSVADRFDLKHFREDDGLMVDVTDKNRPRPVGEVSLPLAPPAPAPAAAPAATAAAPAPASGPAPASPQQAAAAAMPALPAVDAAPEAVVPVAPVRAAQLAAVQPAQAARPQPAPARMAQPAPDPAAPRAVAFDVSEQEDGIRLDFVFPRRAAAAGFDDRGETVLVFDTIDILDPRDLLSAAGAHLDAATVTREGKATVVRLQFKRSGLVRLAADGTRWSLTTGEKGVQAAEPLVARRGVDERGQLIVTLPLAQVSGVHWIASDSGQTLAVATAYGPGAAKPKPQRFVEFQLEQTVQGAVVTPFADDIVVRVGMGEVTISRASGLVVSIGPDTPMTLDSGGKVDLVADRAAWAEMRQGKVYDRLQDMTRKAAEAPRSERSAARLRLVAFQLANGLHAESLGPITALLADDPNMRNDRRPHLYRAMAQVMMGRNKDADKTLALPSLKDDPEAVLLKAVVDSEQGRFPAALAGFRRSQEVVDAYPDNLQALVRLDMARTAIAMRDPAVAERELTALGKFAPTWLPRDEVELLRAQLDDISGRPEAALAGFKALFESEHRPIAARAQLKGVQLADRERDGSIKSDEAQARLETVALTWRGDDVEIEAMGELGAIYARQQRWRDAFAMARSANTSFPDHPITRKLHDETARQFEELFTTGKADQLPRVDTLALFYDFKEFMPIGRRGDEIIRRLADRLVEVDLLDQAGELLQHQIDSRLNGAARATVAARLAMIRLMNNKPADALRALSSSRLSELPRDVKRARQLLEAKALSDLSRTDLALEVLAGERGPEVDRLRADILWTARRWRETGEAHERMLGDAWRQAEPLGDRQRSDIMRSGLAYVMGNEALSLDRLRTKYSAPMSRTPDARTFAFITAANRTRSGDLRELARAVANAETLMEFMSDYRKRYPDLSSSLRNRAPAGDAKPPADSAAPDAPPPAAGAPKQADTAPAATPASTPGRPG
jgi:tetratricopeptide (TPR) repeat protein